MDGVYLIAPVWGENYIRRMIDVLIPCLLAPDNVPALVKRYPVQLLVYTPPDVMARLNASAAMTELVALGVPIVHLNYPGHPHGGTGMKDVHNMGIVEAWKRDYGLVPLCVDQFIANGWGRDIINCIDAGKRAIVQCGYAFPPQFLEELSPYREGNTIAMSPEEATRVYLKVAQIYGPLPPTLGPEPNPRMDFSWTLPDQSAYLRKVWYPSVNFCWPKHGPVMCQRSADNDFLHQALDSWDEAVVMTSSLQHLVGGIGGTDEPPPHNRPAWDAAAARCSSEELSGIILKNACNDWHRQVVRDVTFWCGEPGPLWKVGAEHHAQIMVDRALQVCEALQRGAARPDVLEAEGLMRTWW